MKISSLLTSPSTTLSFEFFPPKNVTGSSTLFKTIKELIPYKPSFVSVTYGAGGATRHLTHDLVESIHKKTDLNIMAHLTCIGSTKDEIFAILKRYQDIGICNIMALRGDLPKDSSINPFPYGGFRYAGELVQFIKKHFPDFCVGVAGFPEGHPETPNRLKEIDYLKQKIDQGADFICTQLFFNNNDFYDFKERAALNGINCPIVAGIMPIITRSGYIRMADLAGGARYPAKLLKKLIDADDADIHKIGEEWSVTQVTDLIKQKVSGIHLYTLNKSTSSIRVIQQTSLSETLS
ncbi:methylenetetrahydrofolate reductase [NAD(P)H] [bacterium]|jgi:methylenetetrahydrofolate reductase (NADPH)|nr:methylenetetrahydrofolate reductase [NAD(P)H] [bacterium]